MPEIYDEKAFEDAIASILTETNGYTLGNNDTFDRDLAIDTPLLVAFLKTTQPDEWTSLEAIHGTDEVERKVIERLNKELYTRGILDCLRNGITDHGTKLMLAYFRPETTLNPQTQHLYDQNILSVTRQLHFSEQFPNLSIDLVLFLNGLPIATAELKNPFTGQTVEDAQDQYIYTRDLNDTLFRFKARALVHFAIDPNEVYMTTRIEGERTKFLPFNKGYSNGAGNPPVEDDYKTAYLWKEVWAKDSWLDIISRFIHLEHDSFKVDGREVVKERVVFPRYHQLDCVRKLSAHTRELGVGNSYLVQHSAGSGKSKSIAWLVYRLSSLHTTDDKKLFDSVVVVTDRIVLDKQLQDTIYQIEHKQGVVQKIDKDSAQLADALQKGIPVIVTTVQKFPFILDKIEGIKGRKFAVIVDEAHSSQGGETSKKMKEVLAAKTLEEAEQEDATDDETYEDEIRRSMEARGRQDNMSFYAFTATPKAKTLEVFGRKTKEGKFLPFHLYSMRQAIEEGFILDVLKNYITYERYFRLSKQIEDDPQLNRKKAKIALARFLTLHPHNLAQKTEIMVEHFRNVTARKIGGKAKAMVVTSSRLHAVRYWKTFNKYIADKKYTGIKTLVAFSGTVVDEAGSHYREVELTGFREKELPKKFSTDEYKILLVADKYQTGYDEPLLHTMYVDKKLSGVKAVQTLSRLNRIAPGKEDTFVLDFVNTPKTIYDSFQPYYETTALAESTDPNHLYDLKYKLEEYQVYWKSEVSSFSKVFFKPRHTKEDQAKLYTILQPAVERYVYIADKEKKEEFKHTLYAFVRLYAFLGQIIPFQDVELEELYAFLRMLGNALPKDKRETLYLGDEVALEYYRLDKVFDGGIGLKQGKEGHVEPSGDTGSSQAEIDKKEALSAILKSLNERFGTDFTEADRLFIEQIEVELLNDEKLQKQAVNNEIANFKYGFNDVFIEKIIDRMEQNEEIFEKIMGNASFKSVLSEWMLKRVYKKLNKTQSVRDLIKQGESQELEFKSTLRWDVKQGAVNKDLEKVIMKTIAGFLNSEGGQLVIGVEDDGTVLGLSHDLEALGSANRDKFENHVVQLIKQTLGITATKYIRFLFEMVEGKDVCLITVMKSPQPVYVKYGSTEEFFVRTGNSTSPLTISEAKEYIGQQWKS